MELMATGIPFGLDAVMVLGTMATFLVVLMKVTGSMPVRKKANTSLKLEQANSGYSSEAKM